MVSPKKKYGKRRTMRGVVRRGKGSSSCGRDGFEIKTGRWEKWEKLAFLRGLRHHGKGKWKKIALLIPTRTTIQVKTHAQVILKRCQAGEDIFEELNSDDSTTCLSPMMVKAWGSAPRKRLVMTPAMEDLEAAKILADLHVRSMP